MSDLISRSALLEEFAGNGLLLESIVRHCIEKVPAVDAVEVVRCRDCVEYIPWGDDGDRICGRIGSYFGNTKPNDFCSRGMRKMDAEVEG